MAADLSNKNPLKKTIALPLAGKRLGAWAREFLFDDRGYRELVNPDQDAKEWRFRPARETNLRRFSA